MNFRHKLLTAAILLTGSAAAQAQIYKGQLSGANEVPAVATQGTGVGVVSLNTATDQLRVRTTFSGLTGDTTASHIHCCTAPGANAGVATQTPTFTGFPTGVKAGSYDATFNTAQASTWNAGFVTANGGTPADAEAALAAGLAGGQAYLNIHSSTSPGGEIRANLTRFSFVPASNGTTAGLAAALDALGTGTGAAGDRLMSMAMLDNAGQAAALNLLLPVSASVVATTMTNGLYSEYDQLSNRLGGLRGDTGAGVWIRYADRQSTQDLTNRGSSIDADGEDMGVGVDFHLASGLLLGASFTLTEDSLDYEGALTGSTAELEGIRATVYAQQTLGMAFVEAMVSFSQNDSENFRSLGAINGTATSAEENDQWGARLALGTDWEIGTGVTATPQVRLDYSDVGVDGYQELAPGGLGLAVASQDVSSLRLSLGGQIDWEPAAGFSPFIRAFWTGEREHDDVVTRAYLLAGSAPILVRDGGPERTGFTAGMGFNFAGSGAFGGSLSYDVVDNDDFESDILQARMVMRF
jgi:outer membrane autotransporter protein